MNASTLDDERRDIANLVSVFLSKVAFGRDFERMLEFFMNARSAFRFGASSFTVMHMKYRNISIGIMVYAPILYCIVIANETHHRFFVWTNK